MNKNFLDFEGLKTYDQEIKNYIEQKDAATEAIVDTKIAAIIESAPETLNTLNELAQALGDDPNFATTVANQIGAKADKVMSVKTIETGNDVVTIDNIVPGGEISVTIEGLNATTGQIYTLKVVGNNTNWGQVNVKNGMSCTFIPNRADSSVSIYVVIGTQQVASSLTVEYYRYEDLSSVVQEHSEEIELIQNELNDKANSTDLSKVATSGDYNDLINTPAFMYDVDDDGVLFITSDVLPDGDGVNY